MTEDFIKGLISRGENHFIEFKRCGNGFEHDVYETLCAFANHYGGYVLCGVLDNGTIHGIPPSAVKSMLLNLTNTLSNPELFSPPLTVHAEVTELEGKTIIVIHVPQSSEIHSYKKIIYDRANESDVSVKSAVQIAELGIRKQNIFTEQKVFKYAGMNELRSDLIEKARRMAVQKNPSHPWKDMDNMTLLKSARLYVQDYDTGMGGMNLAALLLLGKDDVIGSVCPVYRTDALLRKVNIDRFDDRDIIETNLIESYDRIMEFARKHLWNKFYLDGFAQVNLYEKIVRELASNMLMHREFTSPYKSRFIIEKDCMYTENPCSSQSHLEITPENLAPVSKNPIIAKFFMNIGLADELGSGTINLFKFTRLYSGKFPTMVEDSMFKTTIPLDESYSPDLDPAVGGIPLLSEIESNMALRSERTQYPREAEKEHLFGTAQKIVRLIIETPKITTQKLAETLGITKRAVEQNIHTLKQEGIIERVGSKKSGEWHVIKNT